MLEKLKNKKGLIVFSLILGVILIGCYSSWRNELSLSKNKKMTIGQVTGFRHSSKRTYIEFQYYVNGELYNASDPYEARWPKYVRNAKAIRQQFYFVEYDTTDPNNSKIQIQRKSIGTNTLFKDGIHIKGNVENISRISNSYMDLYISYVYPQDKFKFRTRIHKDSLPCGTIANCEQKGIDLIISKHFPEANNLYYSSYDRIAMKKAKEERR